MSLIAREFCHRGLTILTNSFMHENLAYRREQNNADRRADHKDRRADKDGSAARRNNVRKQIIVEPRRQKTYTGGREHRKRERNDIGNGYLLNDIFQKTSDRHFQIQFTVMIVVGIPTI